MPAQKDTTPDVYTSTFYTFSYTQRRATECILTQSTTYTTNVKYLYMLTFSDFLYSDLVQSNIVLLIYAASLYLLHLRSPSLMTFCSSIRVIRSL